MDYPATKTPAPKSEFITRHMLHAAPDFESFTICWKCRNLEQFCPCYSVHIEDWDVNKH